MIRLQPDPNSPGDVLTVSVECPCRAAMDKGGVAVTRHVATICEAVANSPRDVAILVERVSTNYAIGSVEVRAIVPEGMKPADVVALLCGALPNARPLALSVPR